MYRLGRATVLEIRGKDRSKVLNNVATQDLRTLSEGQSFETFITENKGRSLGHGMAIGLANRHLFVTVPDQGERLFAHFDRFIIMEDAVVKDLSQQFSLWLAKSDDDFPEFMGVAPSEKQAAEISIDGESLIAIWAPWISQSSVLLLVPIGSESNLASRLLCPLIDSDLVDRKDWEAERIKNFWPWYGWDFDDKNLPQEIDRNEQAISFNKGCYLGQETIARLDALGQVQKKLVRLKMTTDELPDLTNPTHAALYSHDLEVGQLRSVAKTTSNEILALGFVKRSHFASGTTLAAGATRIPTTVL